MRTYTRSTRHRCRRSRGKGIRLCRQAPYNLFLSQRQYARMYRRGLLAARRLRIPARPRIRRYRHKQGLRKQPRPLCRQIFIAVHPAQRRIYRGEPIVRRVAEEKDGRPRIHGHRTYHLHHRCRPPHHPHHHKGRHKERRRSDREAPRHLIFLSTVCTGFSSYFANFAPV